MGLINRPIELKEGQEVVDWVPIWDKIDTEYQTIQFYETPDKRLILTLDRFVQFIEGEDEQNYHNNLILPALAINNLAKRALILGGGDGLAARTLFDSSSEIEIDLVELDGKMIELFKTEDRLKELNKNSLNKCTVYTENALHWVPRNSSKHYDIIIADFPDPNSWELKRLYRKEFLSDIAYLLAEKGVISIQCHPDIADWIAHLIKEILGNSAIISYTMPYLDGGKIVIGSKE